LISLRKAPHRRERVQCGRWSAAHHRRVPCAGHRVLPAAKSRRSRRRGTFAEGSTRWPAHTPRTSTA